MTRAAPERRCAIYTRKSTEEGLDQDFNSLHAQREACEAYILSQTGEGWRASPKAYDDGGFSGGNLERPALQRLLQDIANGEVETVVVYKVDRLTRSLADFAKLVERFDAKGVTFVSVTQAFNTTNSMGRLTLNVLLSFAQFEREVTGERIRDKIAMSKAKGIWMGGVVPLGYDLKDRRLLPNPHEATRVQYIFTRYLQLGSVHLLRDELNAQGVRSKSWVTRAGRQMGGALITRGGLFHILRNRLYLGEIQHGDTFHPGQHSAIIEPAIFEAVQRLLDQNAANHSFRRNRAATAPLTGRIFDSDGNAFSPSFSYGRGGRPYRYYISLDLQTGHRPAKDGRIRRLNADDVERFLVEQLRRWQPGAVLSAADLARAVIRLEVGIERSEVVLDRQVLWPSSHPEVAMRDLQDRLASEESAFWEDGENTSVRVVMPVRLKLRGGRTSLDGQRYAAPVARRNVGLVEGLKAAHRDLATQCASPLTPIAQFEHAQADDNPHKRQLSRLAFLAPDLQQMILEGRQPAGLTLRTLLKNELPLEWGDQRQWFASLS